VPVRDVLPTLGFRPVWGTATDFEPAYEFKGGGIDICVAQVTSLYLRPEFMIGGTAFNARVLRRVEQFMPLALESRDQIIAWLAFAVGADFRLLGPVPWFEEGRDLQHLLPWEQRRLELRAQMQESVRLRLLRPPCMVEREGLRGWLNAACRAVGWPPAPGRFTISFDGEILKLRVRSRLVAVQADGSAWPHSYAGELRHLHALPRRLDSDPVEIGIWRDVLQIGRVRLPVEILESASDPSSAPPFVGE
jgi:hypothetical protein